MLRPAFDVEVSEARLEQVEALIAERVKAGTPAAEAAVYAEAAVQAEMWRAFYGRRMREADRCSSDDEKYDLRARWRRTYGADTTERLLNVARSPKARATISKDW